MSLICIISSLLHMTCVYNCKHAKYLLNLWKVWGCACVVPCYWSPATLFDVAKWHRGSGLSSCSSLQLCQ